ncbi:MAG: pyruvate, phosphate dikinase [Alphaproteobacteria bacterium]|nr:pyruvate, phosphate dikinase [Alphaproteobacteria bacterium]
MKQWVYHFGAGEVPQTHAQGSELLGGKGASLAEMSSLGIPVPPGFTITTDVCTYHHLHNKNYPDSLQTQIKESIKWLENKVGFVLGDSNNPLLVSVRSGAHVSMPGMMDTVLNLGLNDQTVVGLAKKTQDPRFAYDSYRRFIQMYGNVVLNVDHHYFEDILSRYKENYALREDTDLSETAWQEIISDYKKIIRARTGNDFPQNVNDQLWQAIGAVFSSWMNQRAITYRRIHNMSDKGGTAVNIQAMVFGNMGENCATGVAFTRNPSTGENEFYGEYLMNAQGEDVVAGIRTPQSLTQRARMLEKSDQPSLEESMPLVFKELSDIRQKLERHFRDMQDIEFTIQKGKLWMLQTRSGKRTAASALKIAVDMAESGLITRDEAINRIDPLSLEQLLHPVLDPKAPKKLLTRGLPASPGAASGRVVFTADEAETRANAGESVILVRVETSPEDIHGMHAAKGILTSRGGMTSHAAVVARGMGRPCVVGASALKIDYQKQTMIIQGTLVKAGDKITLVGGNGEVLLGEVPTIQPVLSSDFTTLMQWADTRRHLKVRANAETPKDAEVARQFGAEGIGLCRTEHMFFEEERILWVRQMILAQNEQERKNALAKLLPVQRDDFIALFNIMQELPVTIRLLDPPLHEFLPHSDREMRDIANLLKLDVEIIRRRAEELHEMNPMLGHRGCRLGISFPEIYEMQVRAILEAALVADITPNIEIMIPLIATKVEMEIMKKLVERVASQVFDEKKKTISFQIGTMIELPRAALRAQEIAEHAEFFSFGTNDLTQTTLGLSRDDAGSFLQTYRKQGIFKSDPFASLDIEGVGELMRMAAERGKFQRPGLKLGICGEHGGDPESIYFCEEIGLDYVSCSPYRVPIARLAAAQATIRCSFRCANNIDIKLATKLSNAG